MTLKLLVVDDNKEVRKVAKIFFDGLGKYDVDYAASLKEGQRYLKSNKYCMAIFDLDMPEDEGGEIVNRAGLGLEQYVREDTFYAFFSGGYFHHEAYTKVYFNGEKVRAEAPDEKVTTKTEVKGWQAFYDFLIGKSPLFDLKISPEFEEGFIKDVKGLVELIGRNPVENIPCKRLLPWFYDACSDVLIS